MSPARHPLHPPRYWSTKSPEGDWDTIVIGSGIGGMTVAALLSQFGKRVLVLEQHYLPGGFTHAFYRQGYVWDVGVHVVGEVTEHTVTGRILDRLTDGRLRWASLGPTYEHFHYPDGFRIEFPDSPERFRETLLAAFPDEEGAIDRYFALVDEAVAALQGHFTSRTLPLATAPLTDWLLGRKARRFFTLRTADALAELTDNERLRTVLTSQWGYYGLPPSRSSFAMHALVAKHYLHGGYFPVGGAQAIGRNLLRTVAEAGGWTRIKAPVEEIVIEGGRARGVRLEGGEEIRARRVISACGIHTTVERLLPAPSSEAPWVRSIRTLEPGPAHLCLYLGFKGDIRRAGATPANQWFYRTWDAEDGLWEISEAADLPPTPVLYCSFPSLKDPEHDPGPEERHTGEIVTFVPWSAFERWQGTRWQHRGEEYDAFKERLQRALLEQFLAHRPELRPMIDFQELSTPLSTDSFCRSEAGSIYGLEHSPRRFGNRWLRARSPIKGLYFAGSEVSSAGVVGAMMGGVLAALAVEPIAAGRFMGRVSRS